MKDEFSSPSLLLLTVRSFQCSGIGTKHLHHFIIELFQLTNQGPGNKVDVHLSSGLSRV